MVASLTARLCTRLSLTSGVGTHLAIMPSPDFYSKTLKILPLVFCFSTSPYSLRCHPTLQYSDSTRSPTSVTWITVDPLMGLNPANVSPQSASNHSIM